MSKSKRTANRKLHLLITSCLVAVSFSLVSKVHADQIPTELIPPDVTLSTTNTATTPTPSTAASSAASSSSTPAPGLSGLQGNPRTPATGLAGGAGQPPPPPKGSSAFNGFPKVMGNYPSQPSQPPDPNQKDPIAVIETDKGTITMRLFQQYAPKTVEAFIEMVNKGFYNGLVFHRVEPGFVIQGGCPYGNGSGMYIDPATNKPRMLMLEASPNLRHNAPGVVAMARFPKNPHSASSQFYITLKAHPSLDMKYTVFGGVISGLDVVQRIQKGDKMNFIRVQPQ